MKNLLSNEFWGRRSGVVKTVTIKGEEVEQKYFKQGQWGNGISNNTRKKRAMRQQPIFKTKEDK